MYKKRIVGPSIIAILLICSFAGIGNSAVEAQDLTVFKISTHADNVTRHDHSPQIAVDNTGNSYVVWYGHDGNDYEIYWVKVDAAGTPGTVQMISTHADNVNSVDQNPQVGVDSAGNSYVVWEGYDGYDNEIYWVKVDAAGTPGTVQMISTHADNVNRGDYDPQIGVDSSGNSYVTWYGHDGLDYEIYWVKVDAAGTPGTVQKISTHADNVYKHDYDPQIGVDSSGNSYVTWYGQYGTRSYDIYWVAIDAAGTPGTVQKISTHADNVSGSDYSPQIATDSAGNSYVVWYGSDGYDNEIYWVHVDAAGTPGTVQKISTHADNISASDYNPQIAVDSSQNSYAAWHCSDGYDNEIYWVHVDAAGTPGTVQKISTHADNENEDDFSPQIAVDSSQNSYVVWHGYDGSDDEIYWAHIDAAGTPGTVQKISTHADNENEDDWFPRIGVDSSGNSLITWQGDDGNDWEIYFVSVESPDQGDSDGDGIPDEEDACPSENPEGLDANLDGCTDRICDLAGVVQSLGLHHGIENSLVQKATNACKKFNDGNLIAATNMVNAFINAVEAQRGKKISEEDADMLIQFARNAQASALGDSGFPPETPEVTNPGQMNKQMMPLAQHNISGAEELSEQAQDLLSEAQAQGLDTSECEEALEAAAELLALAQEYFSQGNYIAANTNALEAIEVLNEVIAFLTNLLS